MLFCMPEQSPSKLTLSPSSSKPAFLSNRTFAVQLATEAQVRHGEFVGRVEHVDSMRATHFQSLDDLAAFIVQVPTTGFSKADARDAALACARSYRERMAEFNKMPTLDVWYAAIDVEKDLLPLIRDEAASKRAQKRLAKARVRSALEHDFPELVIAAAQAPTIKENRPLIYHRRDRSWKGYTAAVQKAFAAYRDTLPEHRRVLVERFTLADIALKKDMKIKILVEAFTPSLMTLYAEVCGWTLARAHARSGEPAKISGYLARATSSIPRSPPLPTPMLISVNATTKSSRRRCARDG
jgi:hypothetical protein